MIRIIEGEFFHFIYLPKIILEPTNKEEYKSRNTRIYNN